LTTSEFLLESVLKLRDAGVESPRLEAELLLSAALGLARKQLLTKTETLLTQDELARARELVERRVRRVPLQYLTRSVEFGGLEFEVRKGVFIPRPETEVLLLEAERVIGGLESPVVLDVCTGCGVLAVGLAVAQTHAIVHATDLSACAIETARENARKHGVSDRITFYAGDLFEADGLEPLLGKVDVLISNPPYVPTPDIQTLEPEVRSYEPIEALDGGRDGLGFVRRVLDEGRVFVRAGGRLLIEIGWGQAQSAVEAACRAGLSDVRTVKDVAGIERVLLARKVRAAAQ
jgi:release factor glutamine methyltransferase